MVPVRAVNRALDARTLVEENGQTARRAALGSQLCEPHTMRCCSEECSQIFVLCVRESALRACHTHCARARVRARPLFYCVRVV